MTRTFVIVGANMTGGAAVQTLRDEGFDGRIFLVGAEPHLPYERPPLSKEFLRGEQDKGALPLRPAQWYADQDVQTRLGVRVTSIDPRMRTVDLDNGERIGADAVLVATGGRPREIPSASGIVTTLRTLEDSQRLREALAGGGRLVQVGAGFIGAEVAASARAMGAEVTMLELGPVPLARALGEEMGTLYAELHRDNGVDLRTGEGMESVENTEDGVLVRTTAGNEIEGTVVLAGLGIIPSTELAEEAGLEVENGILVDEACRTSVEGIYAAGDVANHSHPVFGRRIRVEHFDNALKMGAHAARTMLGGGEPFTDAHWFWSDQYDVNLQYVGYATEWDEIVIRGSTEDRDFCAFYLKDGVLLACLGMNRAREVRRAKKLVEASARPEPARLRDEDVDIRSI